MDYQSVITIEPGKRADLALWDQGPGDAHLGRDHGQVVRPEPFGVGDLDLVHPNVAAGPPGEACHKERSRQAAIARCSGAPILQVEGTC